MNYREGKATLTQLRQEIAAVRARMREAQTSITPEPVSDYVFQSAQGPRRLSELFGKRPELVLIHNMGASCPNCTMWADGFNGVYAHIAERVAFVVCSPDAPDAQQRLAHARGWRFPMVSHRETTFAADMGYRSEDGGWLPGLSVFRREGAGIVRVADTGFHPGDDFCVVWHVLDMVPHSLPTD